MELEVTVYGKKVKVDKEVMKEEIVKYYDAVGIKHFYDEVEEMDDDQLIQYYEASFAKEK